jgi:hypothetical protein
MPKRKSATRNSAAWNSAARDLAARRLAAPGLGIGSAVLALLAALAGPAAEARAADPSAQEMHFVYEVNRARHDPPAWAAEYGLGSVVGGDGLPVSLVGVEPRPPLALAPLLVDSASFKGEEMAANDYFSHQSQVAPDFLWPNELARAFGYPLPQQVPVPGGGFYLLVDDSNQIESLACGYGPGAFDYGQALNAVIGLIVDEGVPNLGHRVHLLAMDEFNALFVEAGAGLGSNAASQCRNYWAFHTGIRAEVVAFLTGVAYDDANANQRYDPGEGLAGVSVDAGGAETRTNAAGGYALAVPGGSHTVSCSGGGFVGLASAQVDVLGFNRAVDCLSGEGVQVDFEPAPEPGGVACALTAALALARLRRRRARG